MQNKKEDDPTNIKSSGSATNVQSNNTDRRPLLKCNLCGYAVRSDCLMEEHFDIKHAAELKGYNKDEPMKSIAELCKPMYKCPVCLSTFVSCIEACRHIAMHTKLHRCHSCDDRFESDEAKKLHVCKKMVNNDDTADGPQKTQQKSVGTEVLMETGKNCNDNGDNDDDSQASCNKGECNAMKNENPDVVQIV